MWVSAVKLTSIEEFLNEIANSGCSCLYKHCLNIGWNLPSETEMCS